MILFLGGWHLRMGREYYNHRSPPVKGKVNGFAALDSRLVDDSLADMPIRRTYAACGSAFLMEQIMGAESHSIPMSSGIRTGTVAESITPEVRPYSVAVVLVDLLTLAIQTSIVAACAMQVHSRYPIRSATIGIVNRERMTRMKLVRKQYAPAISRP